MPIHKVSDKIAKLILDLDAQEKAPAEIAQILNLKKVQVSTILASKRLTTSDNSDRAELDHQTSETDGAATPVAESVPPAQPVGVTELEESEDICRRGYRLPDANLLGAGGLPAAPESAPHDHG